VLEQIENVPLRTLKLYPGNPRKGDVGLIAQSLEANGQYVPVVVQRSTRHILKGNHTVRAARKLGWKAIAAVFVDVDDTAAARIVLADNKTSDAGTYDEAALVALLASLDDLAGTGYEAADLEQLAADIDQANPLPEPGDGDPGVPVPVSWLVVVEVPDEAAQGHLVGRLVSEGLAARAEQR
jgi:ParB-like chromosome segregation protein Spo0J